MIDRCLYLSLWNSINRVSNLRETGIMRRILEKIKVVIFGVYIFAVLWLTLIDRASGDRRSMLVPFWEFANVIKGIGRDYYTKQIIGNLIMLMPFGFILPSMIKCSLKKVGIISLLFSIGIEVTQFMTGRGLMEFDDVFNNTVGALIGCQIYKLVRGKLYERIKDISENFSDKNEDKF